MTFERVHRIAERFGHFLALLGHGEAMGDDIFIRRTSARGARLNKRGLEPAAMLVAAFKINIGGPVQIIARFQNKSVRHAAVEPDIENIADLFVILRLVVAALRASPAGRC